MEKFIVDTQVYQIVYVACVGSNNQWKTDNAPNYFIWLDHIITNDEVRGLTPRLGWMEDPLYCIIDTFANIHF